MKVGPFLLKSLLNSSATDIVFVTAQQQLKWLLCSTLVAAQWRGDTIILAAVHGLLGLPGRCERSSLIYSLARFSFFSHCSSSYDFCASGCGGFFQCVCDFLCRNSSKFYMFVLEDRLALQAIDDGVISIAFSASNSSTDTSDLPRSKSLVRVALPARVNVICSVK